MFIGESVSIIGYIIVLSQSNKKKKFRRRESQLIESKKDESSNKPPVPTNLIFAISASSDLMASTINTFGLTYLTISMYQMLSGFKLIFFVYGVKFSLKIMFIYIKVLDLIF